MPACPKCRRNVSYDAEFCPNCGKKKPGQDAVNAQLGFIILIIVIIFLVYNGNA